MTIIEGERSQIDSETMFSSGDMRNSLDLWKRLKDEIKRRNGSPNIINDLWITEERIERAWDMYRNGLPPGESERNVAFSIQSRDSFGVNFGDIESYLPALGHTTEALKHIFHKTLPPLEMAKYEYEKDGKKMTGSLICTPLSIDEMTRIASEFGPKGIRNYARPRILDTARFAQRLGINLIGLGETMAAMTDHGKVIEKNVHILVTTGHAYTTYLLEHTAREAAIRAGVDLKKQMVGIIGCGSIGEAISLKFDSEVKGFVLSDKDLKRAVALMNKLKSKYTDIDVVIAESNEDLCKRTDFIIGSASNHVPLDLDRYIQKGTIFTDDSQPPTVQREVIENKGGIYTWPTAKLKESDLSNIKRNDYNYGSSGLLPGTFWGCEAEALTIECLGAYEFRVNEAATPDKVKLIGDMAEIAGFELSDPLQSNGRPVSEEQFKIVKRVRRPKKAA